jgi:putative methionine-R-sulfoxide reductase with GAF domain
MTFAAVHDTLTQEIKSLAVSVDNSRKLMQEICDRTHAAVARYNWVSFFMMDSTQPNQMVLAACKASFTELAKTLPLEVGMCGAAARLGQTMVAGDVSSHEHYVPASTMVKSGIAVPMFSCGKVIGVMGVESYFAGTCAQEDTQTFVKTCAAIVAEHLEKHPWN